MTVMASWMGWMMTSVTGTVTVQTRAMTVMTWTREEHHSLKRSVMGSIMTATVSFLRAS